ncbi:hypothetical protein [Actinomadura rubteroloni]|nr:hypothetical protein [Actinomadura rubteroloni]
MMGRVLVVTVAAALSLTACGGSDDKAGGGSTPSGNDQFVAFAQCLRQHGMDVPDPKPGQNLGNWMSEADRTKLRDTKALTQCQDKLPAGVLDRLKSPEAQDALLKFARCMRANGVDLPDPKNGQPDFGSVDRDSPRFKAAADKCKSTLDALRGGGR